MREEPLTEKDKSKLLKEVKSTIKIYLTYYGILLGLILLITAILYLFFDVVPVDGLFGRFLSLLWKIIIILFLLSYKKWIMLIDIWNNKKILFIIGPEKITDTGKGKELRISSPVKQNLQVTEELISLLKPDQTLKVEAAKYSKFLLTVSQDEIDLIEFMEKQFDELYNQYLQFP